MSTTWPNVSRRTPGQPAWSAGPQLGRVVDHPCNRHAHIEGDNRVPELHDAPHLGTNGPEGAALRLGLGQRNVVRKPLFQKRLQSRRETGGVSRQVVAFGLDHQTAVEVAGGNPQGFSDFVRQDTRSGRAAAEACGAKVD